MIEEIVRVVAVEADAVWVEARRQSACGRCGVRSGCGHGLLDEFARGPTVHLRLRAEEVPAGLREGEMVRVGIEEHALLAASVRVYALPLVGFLAGAAAGELLVGGDLAAGVGAASGLVVGLLLAGTGREGSGIEAPRVLGRLGAAPRDEAPRPVTFVRP
jgi:sigma-E factor negative regulatory protein RseC